MGDAASTARHDRTMFWGIMAVAVAVRVAAFDAYGGIHPDEVIQYLEQAHRALTGDGMVPWEYREGMRGWALPLLLAGPMALGQAIGGSAFAGIVAARVAATASCLVAVAAAWAIGRRSSRWHGLVAMAVVALWSEAVVMSVHVLSESIASAAVLGAAALMAGDRKRWIAAGALCALAGVLRFHYGPAIAVLAIGAAWGEWRRLGWMAIGAVPVLTASALGDVVMGQAPFEWLVANVRLNLIEDKAAMFGVEPPNYYFRAYGGYWGLAGLAVFALALLSGPRYRLLLLVAAVNVALHSAIGHKEYRFIALSTAILIMLAAIGSVSVVFDVIAKRGGSERARAVAAGVLIAAWAALSLASGWSRPLEAEYRELGEGYALSRRAGADPRVCGMAMMGVRYTRTSHAYLGRPMPIYVLPTKAADKRIAERPAGDEGASFNAVIAAPGNAALLAGHRRVACGPESGICLYQRPGGCRTTPEAAPLELQRYLERIGL